MEVVITPDEDFAPGTPCDVEEHNLNHHTDEVEEAYDYNKSEMSLEDALTSL